MTDEAPEQDYPEVREILGSVCNDQEVASALYAFLISGNIGTARAVGSLSPAFIAASLSNIPVPEGKNPALWKGTIASLLAAARDEAADQLLVQVTRAKRDVSESSTPLLGKSTAQKRRQSKLLTSSMKLLATKLGCSGLPASLVPPQKMFDCLWLNMTTFVDFNKFMSQTSELSSNAADGVLAEDLEGRPVLIKSTSTPQNGAKQQRERNLTAKWSRAFWWFAIALLSVQEALHLKDGSLGNSVDIPNACLANVELEGQPIDNVMILDLLQYFHKILWYATEYNWSVAIAVDRAIRMAIEDACRGGSRTLADCYRNLDLWSAKASEAANLSMGTPRSARSSYLGGDSPSDKPWASSSSSRRLSPSTPSRQGFKRPRDNRFPARLPPPKQQYPNSNNNDNKSSNYNKHDITPKM